MASTVVLDSRIRSLLVLLPALGVAVWIASEIASEEFIIPLLVMMLFATLVVFSVFVQSVRFEDTILNLLLVGYLVGNRGFADLTVAKPFYPGEVCLAAIVLAMITRYVLTREVPDFKNPLMRAVLVFCALGAVRLALDYNTYRMDALHDAAMVYYSLYFLFGRQMTARPEAVRVFDKCLRFALMALVPVAGAARYAPEIFVTNTSMTVLYQKDDLLTTFAAAAVFLLYTRPHLFRWKGTRMLLIVYYLIFVVNGIGRASIAALMVGSLLLLLAGQRRFFLYPVIALAVGVTALASFSVGFGKSQGADPTVIIDKVSSMFDYSGSHTYHSDMGDLKAANNEFRRRLWDVFIDETNIGAGPVFGRGFGYDFVAHFEDPGLAFEAARLRSAHNYIVTLYGRMGALGLLVFAWITWQLVTGGVRAALAVRAGWLPIENLGMWCACWAIYASSIVGVVLEGPVGAIVFWSFLGIAHGRMQQAAAEHARELADEATAQPLPPLARPEFAGGAFARARS